MSSSTAPLSHPLANPTGATLLHIAARCGVPRLIHFLADEEGLDPNARDAFGRTPMHDAAAAGRDLACLALLLCGGRLDVVDMDGDTPADLARQALIDGRAGVRS